MKQDFSFGTRVKVVDTLDHFGGMRGTVVDPSEAVPGVTLSADVLFETDEGALIAVRSEYLERERGR